MKTNKYRILKGKNWIYADFNYYLEWNKRLDLLVNKADSNFRFDSPLCEYTGVNDLNGKEIYEKHLIIKRFPDGDMVLGEVKKGKYEGNDCWLVKDIPLEEKHWGNKIIAHVNEIIGNTYQDQGKLNKENTNAEMRPA